MHFLLIVSLLPSPTAEFSTYLNFCRSLRFDDKPDYSYLRQLFRNLFHRQGFSYDYVFDWNMLKFVSVSRGNRFWPHSGPSKSTCTVAGSLIQMLWYMCVLYFDCSPLPGCQPNSRGWRTGEEDGWRKGREDWRSPPGLCIKGSPSRPDLRCCQQGQKRAGAGHLQSCLTSPAVRWVFCPWCFRRDYTEIYRLLGSNMVVYIVRDIILGNTSPRAISRAERERKVSMRLHRGAPANVSSSDLTARHDQSRISTSQVRWESKLSDWFSTTVSEKDSVYIKGLCSLSSSGERPIRAHGEVELFGAH